MSLERRSVSAGSPGHPFTSSTPYPPPLDARNGISPPSTTSLPAPTSSVTQQRLQAYNDARAGFRSLRKEFQRKAADGRVFVPVKPLIDELHLTGLLENLRESTNDRLAPNTTPIVAQDDLDEYTIVFCILVEIGLPRLFSVFRNHGDNDAKIPFSRHRLTFLANQQDLPLPTFVDSFAVEQLAWCPIRFGSDMGLDQRNRIEPFCYQSPISSSGKGCPLPPNNASLFEVHIPEDVLPKHTCWLLDDLGACVATNTEAETQVSKFCGNKGKRYRAALKRFPLNKRKTFEREKLAFETIRDQDGLIHYIASYQTINDKEETHYNILLEYAELDLYNVVHREEPPVSQDKILAFWEAMLGLCRVLEAIRTVKVDGKHFDVYHCDIKPENILRTGGRFKLADLGETRIYKSDPEDQPMARITGGTMTYASPEKAAYLNSAARRPSKINQNSDIWSMGAVLSNAATYVVLGKQGVIKYNRVRCSAVMDATMKGGDGFHDGHKVLEAVTEWHRYLRDCSRRHDNTTPAILDLVDQHMLVDSDNRYDSARTVSKLECILMDTASGFPKVPPLIEKKLGVIEDSSGSARERSTDSTMTSVGTTSVGDYVAIDDDMSESKVNLLSEQILPTAPQGRWRLQGQNTISSTLTRTNTQLTTQTRPRLASMSTKTTAIRNPRNPRVSSEEYYQPYKVFKLREDLDELDKKSKSKGGILGRRRSFFRSRQESVRDRWKKNEDQLEDAFAGRDIIFLVDNGDTMKDHWQEATELLETLIRRADGYDDDGIDLYFTGQGDMGSPAVKPWKQQPVDFVRAMDRAKPGANNEPPKWTDMSMPLVMLMGRYLSKKKPKTIIILTDGIWKGQTKETAVDDVIVFFLEKFGDMHRSTTTNGNLSAIEEIRPLTIQFVRFGHDPVGSERLQRLDDCLVDRGVEDMVDCEPSTGDVYKIFLGSLLKYMDEKENVANMVSTTTPSISRGPSLRNGNRGPDDDDGESLIGGFRYYG